MCARWPRSALPSLLSHASKFLEKPTLKLFLFHPRFPGTCYHLPSVCGVYFIYPALCTCFFGTCSLVWGLGVDAMVFAVSPAPDKVKCYCLWVDPGLLNKNWFSVHCNMFTFIRSILHWKNQRK